MKRKIPLVDGQIYHVFNRSIADFIILHDSVDFIRMLELIRYFQIKDPPVKFSKFLELDSVQKIGFTNYFRVISKNQPKNAQIISYALMPTHIHLILKQLKENGISNFMRKVQDGYSRYFNIKHHRKGPLWESKFQNVLIENDEQLLHTTRYLHLNAVTAKIVNKPGDWAFSSYNQYISHSDDDLCTFEDLLDCEIPEYIKFVNDRIAYQRELAIIKKIMID